MASVPGLPNRLDNEFGATLDELRLRYAADAVHVYDAFAALDAAAKKCGSLITNGGYGGGSDKWQDLWIAPGAPIATRMIPAGLIMIAPAPRGKGFMATLAAHMPSRGNVTLVLTHSTFMPCVFDSAHTAAVAAMAHSFDGTRDDKQVDDRCLWSPLGLIQSAPKGTR
jgi:hypothetical protein